MIRLVTNGRLVNVLTREILDNWVVAIRDGRIIYTGEKFNYPKADVVEINAHRRFLVPGLISAHDHYEMTLMSAVPFAEAVLPKGTTSVIIDPHDLVNVLGMNGLPELIKESRLTPLRAYFMIPSCVPSSPELESAGCHITLKDIEKVRNRKVIGIAEAMDFAGILRGDSTLLEIFKWAKKHNRLIDGHCPAVMGENLCRYICLSGAQTDHESISLAEQIEKLRKGLKVIVRRGSIKEPMSASDLVSQLEDTGGLMLAVDGCISVEDILEHGHMSWAVRQIINEGVDPLIAIQMATVNVARHYRLDQNIGSISHGRFADILFVDDLEEFIIQSVMINGNLLKNSFIFKRHNWPDLYLNSINVRPVGLTDLRLSVDINQGEIKTRVINIGDDSLVTTQTIETLTVQEGLVESDIQKDILKTVVINRYGSPSISVGFVHGFGLKSGAFAGSIGQDSQNIVIAGTNDKDMIIALNRIIELNGGVIVVNQGIVKAEIALPVAGIMTDVSPFRLSEMRRDLKKVLYDLNCRLNDPIFTLSLCITLVVIPEIKMSDKGLVDVNKGKFVDLFL